MHKDRVSILKRLLPRSGRESSTLSTSPSEPRQDQLAAFRHRINVVVYEVEGHEDLAAASEHELVPGPVHACLAEAVQLHVPEEPERERARAPHALPRNEMGIDCLNFLTGFREEEEGARARRSPRSAQSSTWCRRE